jgi:hypothetical protein
MDIGTLWNILTSFTGSGLPSLLILILIYLGYRKIQIILKRQRYMELNFTATDYALQQSLKNGYADHRDAKLKELLEREDFITQK